MSIKKLATLLSAAVFAVVAISGCGPSQESLEKAVGEYLKKNPKVIQDAMRAQRPQRPPDVPLEQRIKQAIKVPIEGAPAKGPADATVTIVEFSDFQCPFCSRVVPTLDQLMADPAYKGKIKLVFRNHPLPFHNNAMSAAKAGLAANEQGKFWEMYEKMFAGQKDLSDEPIKKMAQEIGLNMPKFEASWKSDKFNAVIDEDVKFAQANGATGTPAFFINGVFLKGAQPITGFKEVIDKILGIAPTAPAPAPAAAAPAPAAKPAAPAAANN